MTTTQSPGGRSVGKQIRVEKDVDAFKHSEGYQMLINYLEAFCAAVEGCPRSACRPLSSVENRHEYNFVRYSVQTMLPELVQLVHSIPLQDMKAQRFGNKSFRTFHEKLTQNSEDYCAKIAGMVCEARPQNATTSNGFLPPNVLAHELRSYLLDSFGNPTRLDFGTGHELHFLLFLICCFDQLGINPKALVSETNNSSSANLSKEFVRDVLLHVFWQYIEFVRLIQGHYSLEPAGSHGVWGLDDYHHLPYLLGASQLIGHEVQPESSERVGGLHSTLHQGTEVKESQSAGSSILICPKDITERVKVTAHAAEYMYFAAIQWIYENKRGPFHEHSSMLYNISGLEKWQKIRTGMLKMYEAEVLGKYNVVQHLLFGSVLRFPTTADLTAPLVARRGVPESNYHRARDPRVLSLLNATSKQKDSEHDSQHDTKR